MSFSVNVLILDTENGGLLRVYRYLQQRELLLNLVIVCSNAERLRSLTPKRVIPYQDIRHELQQHNLLFTCEQHIPVILYFTFYKFNLKY